MTAINAVCPWCGRELPHNRAGRAVHKRTHLVEDAVERWTKRAPGFQLRPLTTDEGCLFSEFHRGARRYCGKRATYSVMPKDLPVCGRHAALMADRQ